MKRRNGFVSNSSSSSFCIFGFAFEFDDFKRRVKSSEELIEKLENHIGLDDLREEILKEYNETENKLNYLLDLINSEEGIIEILHAIGLSGEASYEDERIWVGNEWSSIGDDELGIEFKKRVKEEISEFLDVDDVKPYTHREVIYN